MLLVIFDIKFVTQLGFEHSLYSIDIQYLEKHLFYRSR
jgi:hypothetical protein